MIRRAVQIVILIILATSMSGCRMLFGCGGAEAKKAMQLDPAYLSQLYAYVASDECKDMCRSPVLDGLRSIGNRGPVLDYHRRGSAQVKLSVCMDTGAILYFRNIGKPDGFIEVAWNTDGLNWQTKTLWTVSERSGSNPVQ